MKQYQLQRRAEEQVHRVANKMQRVPHSFGAIARQWKVRAEQSSSPGHRTYGFAQHAEWHHRALSAENAFQKIWQTKQTAPPTELPLDSLLLDPQFWYSPAAGTHV